MRELRGTVLNRAMALHFLSRSTVAYRFLVLRLAWPSHWLIDERSTPDLSSATAVPHAVRMQAFLCEAGNASARVSGTLPVCNDAEASQSFSPTIKTDFRVAPKIPRFLLLQKARKFLVV